MTTPRRITTVFHFPNGMTAVCDQFGEQMPEYQGPTADVRARIERDAPPDAEVHDAAPPGPPDVPRPPGAAHDVA